MTEVTAVYSPRGNVCVSPKGMTLWGGTRRKTKRYPAGKTYTIVNGKVVK